MKTPVGKVNLVCAHVNEFTYPLPQLEEIVYCYRCADYQAVAIPTTLDGLVRSTRTYVCRRGHPRTMDNIYVNPKGDKRQCRVCMAEHRKKTREKKKRDAAIQSS